MPSIHKRLGSNVWQCSFYVPDSATGRSVQVRKSTGETSRQEALRVAVDLERDELEKVGAGKVKARRIKAVLTRAGEEAVKGTLNAARARELLAEIVAISTGEEMPSFSIKTWLEEWQRRKSKVTTKATTARYKTSVKAFLAWLGDRADKPLESLTVADVREFRDVLQDEGRTARTCNHYCRDIASAFRSAVREGLIAYNPASGLEALPTDDSITREPFSTGEVAKLIKAAPSQDWKGVILTGAFTWLRLGDLARLKWGAVDLAAGVIQVVPSKTKRKKREVVIPIHSDLRAFLEDHPISDDPEAPVFPSLAKKSVAGKVGLSLSFVGIMDAAGVSRGESRIVPGPESGEGNSSALSAGRTTHARGFHSLRHSFATWLANEDVPEDLRMLMAGHSDPAVHRGYSHHQVETLARAIEKLPGLTQSKDARSKT